jgi:iron complex transport system substrate-binding protein
MRIVSLVPHATELLFALGLEGEIVGVTHECDYPPQALSLPQITRDVLPPGLSAAEIDAAVRERTLEGEAIYELDAAALRDLEPDLIVTQALCPVCAVSYEDVAKIAEQLPSRPKVIALDPKTVGETLGDVRTLAEATGRRREGVELIARSSGRIDRVRLASPRRRSPGSSWRKRHRRSSSRCPAATTPPAPTRRRSPTLRNCRRSMRDALSLSTPRRTSPVPGRG